MKTVAEKALKLLSKVPSDKFIIGKYTNYIDCCCAMGHIQRLCSNDPNDYSFKNCDASSNELLKLCKDYLKTINNISSIIHINDNTIPNLYPQQISKERVIVLLKDMIKAGY